MLKTCILTDTRFSYRYNVELDGTFCNRKTIAYVSPRFPDGVHCDTLGHVCSGTGDGIQF